MRVTFFTLVSEVVVLLSFCQTALSSRIVEVNIPFQGVASGGTLILGSALGRNAPFVSIETHTGESAESVVNKLAVAIASSDAIFDFLDDPNHRESFIRHMVTGSNLRLSGSPSSYFFAGTENGFGIPKPPTMLSCSYDLKNDEVKLYWENPPEDYDSIAVVMYWHNYDHGRQHIIPGNLISYTINRKTQTSPVDLNDLDVKVFGLKKGVPSGSAGIHLGGNGNSQEELYGIPFTNGVAPNWKTWSVNNIAGKANVSERTIRNLAATGQGRPNSVRELSKKPFKQILKTPAEGGTVGIWRQFLGLTPGHTYRLSARLSTLETDPNKQGWSFSLHAIAERKAAGKLTENQMAGLAALPDGRKGPEVGKIGYYGMGITTAKGEYAMNSAEITLPVDSNSITVWLRLTGKNTSGVGFDWIKLEDLGVK